MDGARELVTGCGVEPHLRWRRFCDLIAELAAGLGVKRVVLVGAFLADSDRNVLAVGIGLDWLDVAFAWTTFDQRIVSTSDQGLNGNYRANAWTFLVSATK